MERIPVFLIGYIFGCFQSSFILVRLFKKEDIRSVGSGNAGAMNTLLSHGVGFGAATLILDAAKTVLGCVLCLNLFENLGYEIVVSYCALGVALGHEFPVWLKFRGGKGVAVALAFMLMLDYRVFLLSGIMSIPVMLITKKLWLGSVTLSGMMALCVFSLYSYETGFIVLLQSVPIICLHLIGSLDFNEDKKKIENK